MTQSVKERVYYGEFEFSAHTFSQCKVCHSVDRHTNWMLTNFGRT